MLNDIVNSVKATLYDRTSSPLFGSFVVSWAVWNHRLLVVFLAGGEFKEKLAYVDTQLYPTWYQLGLVGFILPLVTALLFIFCYPLPARKVYEFTATQQRKLRDLRRRIEGDELITAEEARKLREKYLNLEMSFDDKIQTLEVDRADLRKLVASLTDQSKKLEDQVADLIRIKEERDQLAKELEQARRLPSNGPTYAERLPTTKAEQRAANLVQTGSGLPTTEAMTDTIWRLTHNPRARNSSLDGKDGSKRMHLRAKGEIGEGRNEYESTWQMTNDGRLEFIQEDGQIHSRFILDRSTGKWLADPHSTLRVRTPNQYIEPDVLGHDAA